MANSNIDFVFVVLVYRNVEDLKDFFSKFYIPNSKVIVVNSFYDNDSEREFQKIAESNNADFLTVPNKGYGAGNNRGIEYALARYDFKYLIISNADIIIKDLHLDNVKKYGDVIIAPEIRNADGLRQNPSVPFTPSRLREHIQYWMVKGGHLKIRRIMFIWSRISKIVYYMISKWKKTIFSAHGSFVIIPRGVLECLHPLYDERMFLFTEEEHLGRLAASKCIKTYYAEDIKIYHKEDGSMSMDNVNVMQRSSQSYIIYYENWIKR